MLTFIEGDVRATGACSLEGAFQIGRLFRALHAATGTWTPPPNACWYPPFGRDMGGPVRVIGHCDTGPWNIVSRDGLPVALIDWEWAGPVDPRIELAEVCWANAGLHDDIVAERAGLPSLPQRAQLLCAIVDGYGLSRSDREGFVSLITEFAINATAFEIDLAGIRPDTAPEDIDGQVPWAMPGELAPLSGSSSIAPSFNKR